MVTLNAIAEASTQEEVIEIRARFNMKPNVRGEMRARATLVERNLPPILLTPGLSCQLFKRRWRHVVER